MEYPMYFGATPDTFQKAKELRKTETEAEKILWTRLAKNKLFGLPFRRQHPINQFIVDFYCPKLKLAIEADGNIHEISENKIYDAEISKILNGFGITVIRFSNDLIVKETDNVIQSIKNTAENLSFEAQKSPIWGI